jgi:hypothetical protein
MWACNTWYFEIFTLDITLYIYIYIYYKVVTRHHQRKCLLCSSEVSKATCFDHQVVIFRSLQYIKSNYNCKLTVVWLDWDISLWLLEHTCQYISVFGCYSVLVNTYQSLAATAYLSIHISFGCYSVLVNTYQSLATGVYLSIHISFGCYSVLVSTYQFWLLQRTCPYISVLAVTAYLSIHISLWLLERICQYISVLAVKAYLSIRISFGCYSVLVNTKCHSKRLVQQIGNYTPADLTNTYRKYKHNRPQHILL